MLDVDGAFFLCSILLLISSVPCLSIVFTYRKWNNANQFIRLHSWPHNLISTICIWNTHHATHHLLATEFRCQYSSHELALVDYFYRKNVSLKRINYSSSFRDWKIYSRNGFSIVWLFHLWKQTPMQSIHFVRGLKPLPIFSIFANQ